MRQKVYGNFFSLLKVAWQLHRRFAPPQLPLENNTAIHVGLLSAYVCWIFSTQMTEINGKPRA
jgi:hypothetical protein